MAGIHRFPASSVYIYLIIISALSFAATKSSGFILKLIPRDSSESPLYPGKLTQLERIKRLVHVTNAKTELKALRSAPNSTFEDSKYLAALQRHADLYIAEVKIGNPPQTVYLMVDTGGGLIWTQCQPCINCFPQEYPIYDSRTSSTYQRIPCEHPHCTYREERTHFSCVNGDCVYRIYYSGGNVGPTKGFASLESFHFLTNEHGSAEEFTLLFGCSNDNTNFDFDEEDNMISGILGLNLSPESLLGQLSNLIGNIFSYCVVPFDEDYPFDMHPHVLRFGDDVVIPPGNIPTTRYFTFYGAYYYFLECLDISVGAHRVGLPVGTFDASLNSGFYIDSGAPMSLLTTRAMNGINVFQIVMTAFAYHYNNYHLVRVPENENPTEFQLCYWNQEGFTNFPSLTYHLRGADYTVDARYVHVDFEIEGFFCVGMLGGERESVLGANHMQNMRIIHNGNINSLQFYHFDCAHDHL